MHCPNIFFERLIETLPPIFCREEAARQLGGIFTARTLKNMDCRGDGPQVTARIGKKVAYERDSFVHWLREYSRKA